MIAYLFITLIFLIILVSCAVFCITTAQRKGRNPVGYGILGFLLPLIGIIVVLVISNRNDELLLARITSSQPRVSVGQSRARRDQLICVATALILLGCIFALQPTLTQMRSNLVHEPPMTARGLAVAFPRLTLSGFRGLLATTLWIRAEDDKNNHKWQQLETDYNYIATLEPYFTSVYVFNAWNQAYNLSAQWHNDKDKYKWVLDGLMHLYEGETYNPSHPDLVVEQGHMFMQKLGGAYERIFYRSHWRYDIAHLYELNNSSKAKDSADSAEAEEVQAIVLRPEFHAKLLEDGHGLEISDYPPGSKEPMQFRHGISPYYFGYCEYLRCLAQPTHPSSIGYQIVQSYPAMCQRLWCHDDLYYAADTMREMFLQQNPETDVISATGKPPAPEDFDERVDDLRDCFRNIQKIAPKAINDFKVYIQIRSEGGFPQEAEGVHRKHIIETEYFQEMGLAESALFEGLVKYTLDNRTDQKDAWVEKPKVSDEAKKLFIECIPHYQKALDGMDRYAKLVFPPVSGMPNPDYADFQKYINAVNARIEGARAMLTLEPGKKPDFMFLKDQIQER